MNCFTVSFRWPLLALIVIMTSTLMGSPASAQQSRDHLEKSRRDLRSKVGEISSFMSSCMASFDQGNARVLETLVCDGEQILKNVTLIAPDHYWSRTPSLAESQSFFMGVMLEFGFEVRAVVRTGSYDQVVFQRLAKSRQVDSQTF